ncbi:hypothetical protein AJ79_02657 [Helicocarpus griseus UAMH5409]|uniref:SprT-like domain-containing protein n=1 Tax=Helicocarpus griseus UAMH5409 TaxID=1447875 RepID=A0A2B7Y257_9EURO|nr:hypothetical protein AJ79_02657 [Helicocarpus griseus UAMH5409]
MARLNRPALTIFDIHEDSDSDNANVNSNANAHVNVKHNVARRSRSVAATKQSLPKPTATSRSSTKPPSRTRTYDDDGDEGDTPPRDPANWRQRQRRRKLGPRHANSLLMPFPAAIDRYDGLTQGRSLADIENAPLPEQLEEYKYGEEVGRGVRRKEGMKKEAKKEAQEKERELEVAKKFEWREKRGVESEDEEEGKGHDQGENEEDDEFDSLDDFIVGDDEDISYFEDSEAGESSGESDGEEEVVTKRRSSPRKLFRGRRKTTPKILGDEEGTGNNTSTGRESAIAKNIDGKAGTDRTTPPPVHLFEDSSDADAYGELIPSIPKKLELKPPSLSTTKSKSAKKRNKAPGDKMDDSPPDSQTSSPGPSKPERTVTILTPPSSPSKPRLYSPSKSKSRIPPSPHRPSIDAFWSQEVINEWNDQYSPRKMNTPRRILERFRIDSENEDEDDEDSMSVGERSSITSPQPSPSKSSSPVKGSPTKKATAAAAAKAKKAAAAKKKAFDEKKVGMAEDFFKALDDCVTGGEIQRLAAPAGGVKIVWSKTLNTTAGRANWKRETIRQKPSSAAAQSSLRQGENTPKLTPSSSSSAASANGNAVAKILLTPSLLAPTRHHASIELASKIIDSPHRLLNTLAHEYCHLANFMISNVRNNPHGASFKAWAARCERTLATHPVYGWEGVKGDRNGDEGEDERVKVHITTKHSYTIHYKYLWACVQCGNEYGRHSRSIDVKKSRCGRCKVGALVQVRPKPRGGGKEKGNGALEGVTKSMGVVKLDNS